MCWFPIKFKTNSATEKFRRLSFLYGLGFPFDAAGSLLSSCLLYHVSFIVLLVLLPGIIPAFDRIRIVSETSAPSSPCALLKPFFDPIFLGMILKVICARVTLFLAQNFLRFTCNIRFNVYFWTCNLYSFHLIIYYFANTEFHLSNVEKDIYKVSDFKSCVDHYYVGAALCNGTRFKSLHVKTA